MINSKIKIGIIGGTGLDNPSVLDCRREVTIETPFGNPSDVLIEGTIDGVDCVLLARHGRQHTAMPSNINYRANIWALKTVGCTHIIASTATGSLREDIHPGDLVVIDNFIDRTTKREQTFYDGSSDSPVGVCHLPMEPAFCERTRQLIIRSAKEINISVHSKGTAVSIEGPRFSSRAESLMLQQFGGDVVNMTTVPEVVLAKEAGICYASIAMATDYDCWRMDGAQQVNVVDVLSMFKKNSDKVLQIIKHAVVNISREDWSQTINDLHNLVKNSVMIPHN